MSTLFETTTINSLTLNNRFVRSATWEGMANPDGSCTPRLNSLMEELAHGHVGLIITGYAFVSREGQAAPFQLGAYSDDLLPGLTEMTKSVHKAGGKIILQIAHGGLFAHSQLTGQEPIGPSVMMTEQGPLGRAMTMGEIQRTVTAFTEAAVRAQKAGFDGVQIHAAHGYHLSQFLSPYFNKRNDEYGGSIENQTRIFLEVVRSVRNAVGEKYPVMVKINSADFLDGGFNVDDMLQVTKILENSGVDAIELSGGTILGVYIGNFNISFSRLGDSDVYYEEAAKRYKKEIGIPLMLVGGIRSYDVCKRLVVEGVTDYISISRPLIREPGLIKRWESGDTRDAECISDNACFQPGIEGKGVYCIHVKQ
ncbi:MAG: NADH:flavin oxidoreductase [Candidatus Latescibacteria bacterium]|nr:NADH:flavin oxidoreductase [Candidatus Latescibacterota bacterium]